MPAGIKQAAQKDFVIIKGQCVKPDSVLAKMLIQRLADEANVEEVERLKKMEAEHKLTNKNEEMESRAHQKVVENEAKQIQAEVIVARQVGKMVRKEAMRQRLKADEDLYQQELNQKGLTFFKERL